MMHDLNFNGARISLNQRLPRERLVKMKISLSDEFTLEIKIWVVWYKSIDGINVYGLYFTKINEEDREKIYKFVYKCFPEEVSKKWGQETVMKKGDETMQDRRIFARFPVCLPLRFIDVGGNKEGEAQTQDISAKGIGLVTNAELSPRTPLEMWLEIPDRGEPLYTRGEVVWSKFLEPNKYRVGVELEEADLMGMARVLRA